MDGLEITYLLKRAGYSQAMIARELGVAQSVVGNVIHNRITCHSVATHIAALLSSDIKTLFPGRYEFKPRRRRQSLATTPPAQAILPPLVEEGKAG